MVNFAWYFGLLSPAASLAQYSQESILKEAELLVSLYTNMTVLDTAKFADQIHLLVDKVEYEPEGAFAREMLNLADYGHIFMTASNSSGLVWPAQRVPVEVPAENDEDFLNKRSEEVNHLVLYPGADCKGEAPPAIPIKRQKCHTIEHSGINSARVLNYGKKSSFFYIYYEGCDSCIKQHVSWHKGRSMTCYKIKTGNSIRWG